MPITVEDDGYVFHCDACGWAGALCSTPEEAEKAGLDHVGRCEATREQVASWLTRTRTELPQVAT